MNLENPQELVGKKYGSTTVLEYIGKLSNYVYLYKCKCDCGKEFRYNFYKDRKVRHCCSSCQSKIFNSYKNPKVFEYNGEKVFLKDLAEKLGINYNTLKNRIWNLKWNKDRWAEPVKRRRNET